MANNASLASTNGTNIALKSVHIHGVVNEILATVTIKQRYLNDSGKKLEIVYTFPLAWGATLMDMEVRLGKKKMQAQVIKKADAWQQYEDAIDIGDTPILVEQASPGLYTANLGNIKNGEEVYISITYAQLLHFEGDTTQLRIPSVIAPRYGNPYKSGGLAAHETDMVSMLAEYPLTLKLSLEGQAAMADVQCLSHAITVRDSEDGREVLLNSKAMLDRDFILSLDGLHDKSFALISADEDECAALAVFRPAIPKKYRENLHIKILMDCSGSMAGDSMAQAKQVLFALLGLLEPGDYVSYSRFGNSVLHHHRQGMIKYSADTQKELAIAFAKTAAYMGGTELEHALNSTFNNIPVSRVPGDICDGELISPCVMLITDGEVWGIEEIINNSRNLGHRIFAVGVGSAPAESLLQELAQETGGVCKLLAPNENGVRATELMLEKMRQARAHPLILNWGSDSLWESKLPANIYCDNVLHTFATLTKEPKHSPTLDFDTINGVKTCCAETISYAKKDTIARLAGAARMAEAATEEEALALALKYQLLSKQTSLFLVHVREGEKNTDLPILQHVPQMMAAGYGGSGSVRSHYIRQSQTKKACASCVPPRSNASILEGMMLAHRKRSKNIGPAFPTPDSALSKPSPLELLQLLDEKMREFTGNNTRSSFAKACHIPILEQLRERVFDSALTNEEHYAIILWWLANRLDHVYAISKHSWRILRRELKKTTMDTQSDIKKKLDEQFPYITPNSWDLADLEEVPF